MATSNYRVNAALMIPGMIYADESEMPEILETEMCGNIGDIRALIVDYIMNVKKGVIRPEKNGNWKITGFTEDPEKQKQIGEMIRQGKLEVKSSKNGRYVNTEPITEEMLERALKEEPSEKD